MIITKAYPLLFVYATASLCLATYSEAFQTRTRDVMHVVSSSRSTKGASLPISPMASTEKTRLYNLFGNLFGQDSGNKGGDGIADDNPLVDVIDVPAEVIKTKPLKFFLQIFFVGIQNEPFKGAWLMNANEEVEEYLEVYFADGTGMLSVRFEEDYGLRIQRKGKRPSLQYMLQESVLLHSVLDELESIAFGDGDNEGEIKDEERLLQFAEGNEDVLSVARSKLPARAAPAE
mmetsp:Transcript_2824/g.7755  ORF Transcript_2824/g.7755 Transcript_2824/m.7755 type:complete len:232 (+) Transcript_2824:75-770(+)|eukprot:CAMPEP_0197185830 /NCGR_PEP_ID=MMETSP1423-20130617/12765_1 /TAXON_ID=476441 /ORGANISM="Pseudo-nitzschia heimii, Strain UNC1101" /LENGTH=231 /DNA_ID=CAMNT_0042636987 /DNA_START=46 /DNA_END=741 /DNA_ORIENTATION=-